MKRALVVSSLALLAVSALTFAAAAANKVPGVGDAAPGFTLANQAGAEVKLEKFSGKIVVLEWFNKDCPFVQRHYKAGTFAKLAASFAEKDVVWLAIDSTNYTTNESNAKFHKDNSLPYDILNDASGATGRAYGATRTPEIVIIDTKGAIVYRGAIDSDPKGGAADVTRFVENALNEITAGKAVSTSETKPYGCTVKYKN